MNINVLEITEKNAYLIKPGLLQSQIEYYLNDELISNELKKNSLTISKDDKFQFMPNANELLGYERGKEFLTVEEYRAKPQYYSDEHSDEDVLRAIANKKELEGFIPKYKEKQLTDINLEIYGYISDTNSNFIMCGATNSYNSKPVIYSLNVNKITIDEYNILKDKYSDHAKFDKLDRTYLRFTKINNSYTFSDCYPFTEIGDEKIFTDLLQAKDEESKIRESVKNAVLKEVFPTNISDEKKLMIASQLKLIVKLKNKKEITEMLNLLIEDLEDYSKNSSAN